MVKVCSLLVLVLVLVIGVRGVDSDEAAEVVRASRSAVDRFRRLLEQFHPKPPTTSVRLPQPPPAFDPIIVAFYSLPKVALKTQDGKAVALPELIDDGRPVLLNFIYTSCTSICPPMAQIFAATPAMPSHPPPPGPTPTGPTASPTTR